MELTMTIVPIILLMITMPLSSNLPRTLSMSHVRPYHKQGAAEDAQVAADHLDGVVGYDKLELCEHGDEQQDDERI